MAILSQDLPSTISCWEDASRFLGSLTSVAMIPAGEFREHHQNQGLRQPGKLCLNVARSKAFGLFLDSVHAGRSHYPESPERIRHLDMYMSCRSSAGGLMFFLQTSPVQFVLNLLVQYSGYLTSRDFGVAVSGVKNALCLSATVFLNFRQSVGLTALFQIPFAAILLRTSFPPHSA